MWLQLTKLPKEIYLPLTVYIIFYCTQFPFRPVQYIQEGLLIVGWQIEVLTYYLCTNIISEYCVIAMQNFENLTFLKFFKK